MRCKSQQQCFVPVRQSPQKVAEAELVVELGPQSSVMDCRKACYQSVMSAGVARKCSLGFAAAFRVGAARVNIP